MPSYDQTWVIERYPFYDDGELECISYGCPSLNLMGYNHIQDLVLDMIPKIKKLEDSLIKHNTHSEDLK